MPCPGEGPCKVWDLDLGCCLVSGALPDPCLNDGSPVPQEIVDAMKLAASQFMWRATGMQFGCCQVTLRPLCSNKCPTECGGLIESGFGFPWMPLHLASGEWTNVTCNSQANCTCVEVCSVPLPYPVCSVDEVKVNGKILDPSEYKVYDFNKLTRLKSPQTVLRQTELGTVQAGIDVPGDQYCFSPDADSGTSAVLNGDCWDFTNSNPTFVWNSVESFTAFYNDPTGPEGAGVFRVRNIDTGDWDFPVNPVPMTVGETRWSNPEPLTGDSISLTWNGPGVGPHIDTLAGPWVREGGGQFTVTNLSIQPGGCWPECNNILRDDTEEDTWSVKVTYGRPVPELLRLATAQFACELIKMCIGKPCGLPQRVTSISRQGMNASFLDPMEFMKEGFTGLYLVDLAIKTYNPHRLYKKPTVVSPDSLNKWTVETWKSGDPIGPECS